MSDLPPPAQPYRSALLIHGGLAGVIVVVAWLSDGDIVRSLAIAAGYFVVATAWTWFRFRQRAASAEKSPSGGSKGGKES